MALPHQEPFDATQFSGKVRLFPLPNLVLFPHVLQPLHIFEPRYRDLLAEALDDDRLIAMAVLQAGWEADYEGRPPVQQIACLGRVATHVRLPDGRYNLLLAGVARVELGEEFAAGETFRRARATICRDRYPIKFIGEQQALTRRLFLAFRGALPNTAEAQAPLSQLLSKEIDLATLTDIVAYTLDWPVERKAALLADCDVYSRAQQLLAHLGTDPTVDRDRFPPGFSVN